MTLDESLNNIATISEILVEVSKSHIMTNEAINEIRSLDIGEIYFTLRQALNELEALKKPPTVNEVCKALSDFTGQDVLYNEVTHEFYYTDFTSGLINPVQFITETCGGSIWTLGVYLPLHLITLIGRLYEGLEVKE